MYTIYSNNVIMTTPSKSRVIISLVGGFTLITFPFSVLSGAFTYSETAV